MASGSGAARVDSWLWAVRVYKTRTAAKTAVTAGHVLVNGNQVKPSQRVAPGDRVEARQGPWLRVYEVVETIEKRVGAPRAAECFVDHSPPPPPREKVAPAGVRDRGAGRPTKRDRRRIQDLRGH